MNDEEYSLLLPFDSDDREFVRGVQIGMVFERFGVSGRADIPVYAECAEMLARMRECGLEFIVSEVSDGWLIVEAKI